MKYVRGEGRTRRSRPHCHGACIRSRGHQTCPRHGIAVALGRTHFDGPVALPRQEGLVMRARVERRAQLGERDRHPYNSDACQQDGASNKRKEQVSRAVASPTKHTFPRPPTRGRHSGREDVPLVRCHSERRLKPPAASCQAE